MAQIASQATSSAVKSGIKLYYFPLRARAEPIRMMLAHAGMPYEDEIIIFDEWPAIKEAREICPFGQLPTLKLPDGHVLPQCQAIALYVAKQADLYPSDLVEAAKADALFALSQDLNLVNPLVNFFHCESDDWKLKCDQFFQALPVNLATLEKEIGEGKYFGGTKPSYADFALLHIMDMTLTLKADALQNNPRLQEWIEAMKELPALRQYMTSRPQPPHVGSPQSFIRNRPVTWSMF